MPKPSPTTRRLLENLISNYGYVFFLALIPLFVVPLYRHLLSANAWGSVALCLTLQGFLFALDMAFGPLMLRDVARAAAGSYAAAAYRHFLKIYAGAAAVVFVLGLSLLSAVAAYRLAHNDAIDAGTLLALRLAFVQFLFQFSNNAAIGYWNGLERQRMANLRLAAFTIAKHALALALLITWRADASTYMAAFAFVAVVEFVANYRRIRREHADSKPIDSPVEPPLQPRRDAWAYALAALVGLATAQIDRGYLSLMLPESDYGLYYLIGIPMLTLFSLQMPIQRAYLPRLATAASPQQVAMSMLKVSLVLIIAPSLLLAVFPQLALSLWLHNPQLAQAGAPAFRLLMLASAMNAAFAPAGLLLLNRHRNVTIGVFNSAILLVQAALLIWLTPRIGMLAGAVAWLACGAMQLAAAPLIWRVFGQRTAGEDLTRA